MLRILRMVFAASGLFIAIAMVASWLLFVPGQQARAESPAYVRMIHASPYIGIADLFVDGKKLLGSFEFGSVTDYVPMPVGAHTVQISAVGKGMGAAVLTQNVTIEAGKLYTVAALGVSPHALKLQAFIDDNQVEAGMAKVRVYHLSPDYGQVTLQVGEEDTLKGMQYQDASQYLQVGSGSCTFKASSAEKTISLTTSLVADKVTSIFVIGTVKAMPALRLVSAQAAGVAVGEQVKSKSSVAVQNQGMPLLLVWAIASVFLAVFACVCLGISSNLSRRVHYRA
jgi:Domain of unknown function (DUF4397)